MLRKSMLGILAVLAGSLATLAKPNGLPDKSVMNGKATPPITQDFYQPGPFKSGPGLHPIRPSDPSLGMPPTASSRWNQLMYLFISFL